EKIIATAADTVQIDTLSLVPQSLSLHYLSGDTVSSGLFTVNYARATLTWNQKPAADSVRITYQVFPLLLTKKYFNKDPGLIGLETIKNDSFYQYQPSKNENTLFEFKGLTKSGSISRSVGFGNSQDLSV